MKFPIETQSQHVLYLVYRSVRHIFSAYEYGSDDTARIYCRWSVEASDREDALHQKG